MPDCASDELIQFRGCTVRHWMGTVRQLATWMGTVRHSTRLVADFGAKCTNLADFAKPHLS